MNTDYNVHREMVSVDRFYLFARGNDTYSSEAEQAFAMAFKVIPQFNEDQFRQMMAQQGVPHDAICDFIESLKVYDDEQEWAAV